ncbi:hypothetical protein M9H77_07283 [Catharanthus roseus]|uniref:Uncharacterized protein n=1 Tax=Catharanthus roseus TaxID=4058 RepID=A0ACC0BUW3_CATRO|nr:hypothetical protein M9H77_07283 [Catharanthus roseus]
MSSKFISMSISHLVANDPEIPVSNVMQEVHILFQTANFNKTFKSTELKSLMWQAETELKQWKFDHVMKEIKKRNVDSYIYLVKIDPEKWTLLHDGGHRHGIMTTNISKVLNSVLKKVRVLPLKALVELIFNKLVSCEKWQTYTLPYSHALAVCRENGTRADTYVPEIYSRQTYRKTYQTNFYPVLSENF